jgi:uncharacterized membrane protein
MKYKSDKGVAGLTLLLSIIVTLFVIGLLVMIFSIMGSKLNDSTYLSTTVTVLNETVTFPSTNVAQTLVGTSGKRNGVCNALTYVANQSHTGASIDTSKITKTGCSVTNASALTGAGWGGNGTVAISYTYTWDADTTATNVMNDTTASVGSVTDWFDIFIVISAMVVLVLLVVIIINAIRGSGLIADGFNKGTNKVGTA